MHGKSLKIQRFNPNKLRECAHKNKNEKLPYVVRSKSLTEREIISCGMNCAANIYRKFQCKEHKKRRNDLSYA